LFSSNLQLSGSINNASLNSSAILFSESTTVLLEVQAMRTSTGAPNLRIHSCKVKSLMPIRVRLDVDIVRKALEKEAPTLLDQLICSRVQFVVEDRVNDRFGLLSPKITLKHIADDEIIKDLANRMRARRQRDTLEPMSDIVRVKRQWGGGNMGAGMRLPFGMNLGAGLGRKKRSALIAGFNVSRADNLALDYTITSDMNVTKFGLEIESSGEVSLRGRGGTPFGPVKVSLPQTVNEQFMLQMIVSDFMPNSLMYHGHNTGLFTTRLDPTTPHFSSIMRTTCSISSGIFFCLGDMFPTLKRLHPNR
jgi:hypothetical protein